MSGLVVRSAPSLDSNAFSGHWQTTVKIISYEDYSDNELIRQVKAKMLTSLFGTNSPKNQDVRWDHSNDWEEMDVAAFQLASLRCNSFQSKPCELTLTALIGLHPLSSATVWGQ